MIGLMMTLKKTSYRKLNNPALAFSAIGIVLMWRPDRVDFVYFQF